MADFATEAGHWYRPNGEPYYMVPDTKGNPRKATLRDARKLGLYPGVTTIIRCAAAPGLDIWKRQQVLLAALTLPAIPGESNTAYCDRIMKDSAEQAEKAAASGTLIHGAIEKAFRNEVFPSAYAPWIELVCLELLDKCGLQDWKAERSVAHKYGFGTKLDLHSSEWLIDWKTKDGDESKAEMYDEHFMQLAAGRVAAGTTQARCAIGFVGREFPWCKIIEADEDQLQRGWDMFEALLTYWQAKHDYHPE
jgi:hypothetical protein